MPFPVIPIISGLFSIGKSYMETRAKDKENAARLKQAKTDAKIRRIETLDAADAEWDKIMAQGSLESWKDEFWTIVLAVPVILAFVPGMAPYILAGFHTIAQMPDWYVAAVGIAIAAAFGFRKFAGRVTK